MKRAAVWSSCPSTAAEDVSWICLFLWDTVNTPWFPESQGVLPWKTGIKLQPDTVVAGASQLELTVIINKTILFWRLGNEKHLARALVAARRHNLTSLKQCVREMVLETDSNYFMFSFVTSSLIHRKLCFTLLQRSSLHPMPSGGLVMGNSPYWAIAFQAELQVPAGGTQYLSLFQLLVSCGVSWFCVTSPQMNWLVFFQDEHGFIFLVALLTS